MKTIKLITAIALMTLTGAVTAQDEKTDIRETLQFGWKIGINRSNVYNEGSEEFVADAKAGFAGGAYLRIPIGKYIGLQPEILFSQKGFKGEGSLFGNSYQFSRTTNYLDVPLQIALKPTEFLTIVAGPQYSYLLNQKDKFENTAFSYEQEQEFENDNIRKNIFGIVSGVDINIKNITLGARLGWDLQHNNGDGSSNTPRYKNAWLQGTLGYTF